MRQRTVLVLLGLVVVAWSVVYWTVVRPRHARQAFVEKMAADDKIILPWMKSYLAACGGANARYDAMLGQGFAADFCQCMLGKYMTRMKTDEVLATAKTQQLHAT